ncbi:MAG: FAD binding domain-containing protein [Pirellulaceae bacterium]|nr:FAD binding domain-containing protein [Pirellulaceae bacterium]
MRDYLLFYINGQAHQVSGQEAWLTLSRYLRQRLRLTGTKVVCEEGDCGSCSVLVADLRQAQPIYYPIDACIAFLFQLDGTHIVTVEGLSDPQRLTSVQQAMIDCQGSQCGFCTPGFVMAMTAVMERQRVANPVARDQPCDWPLELSGNLCRCTGYQPILSACQQASSSDYQALENRYAMQTLQTMYRPYQDDSVCIQHENQRLFVPRQLAECVQLKSAFPAARWIAGATDVGVQANKLHACPDVAIVLRHIEALKSIEVATDAITIGAAVSWTEILPVCQQHFPQFAEIIKIFGSPQIRNMGTIGGNLANASPIADSLPLLHVLECQLELVGCEGSRWVNINRFYKAYKQIHLGPTEMIARVMLPRFSPVDRLRLYKVSRRRDLDISTFTAAIRMHIESDVVQQASLAFGAVGPTVVRLPRTEAFLQNQPFTMQTMQAAGALVVEEISPISDVRGSADYRYQLAKNVLAKFYCEETR